MRELWLESSRSFNGSLFGKRGIRAFQAPDFPSFSYSTYFPSFPLVLIKQKTFPNDKKNSSPLKDSNRVLSVIVIDAIDCF